MKNKEELEKKISKGIKWTFVGKIGAQVIQLATGVILSRILTPEDFGLVGMLAVLVSFAGVITTAGLSLAIVQKKDINNDDMSTAFWINFILSLLVSAILILCIPWIVRFFDEARLGVIVRLITFRIILGALVVTQIAKLSRDLKFKNMAFLNFFSLSAGGGIGIFMALVGFSFQSIVYKDIFVKFFSMIYLYYESRWLPKLKISKSSFKKLFGFSIKAFGIKLLRNSVKQIDASIIGKISTSVQTGLYTRAFFIANIPSVSIMKVFAGTMFPILSKVQDDRDLFKESYQRMLLLTIFITFPILTYLCFFPEFFISIVLGEKWLEAKELLRVLAFIGISSPVRQYMEVVVMSKGHVNTLLKLETVLAVLEVLLLIFLGVYLGIWGILIGKGVMSLLKLLVSFYLVSIHAEYPIKNQIKDIGKSLFPFFAMVIFLALTSILGVEIPVIPQVIFSGIIYLIVAEIINDQSFNEIKKYVFSSLKRVFLKKK